MIRYTPDEINNIKEKNIKLELSSDVLHLINSIVSEVGCPSYVKTPSFINKRVKKKFVERPKKDLSIIANTQMILNKFSEEHYDKLKNELIILIDSSKSCDTENSFKEVIKYIYKAVSVQSYNIPLYGRLFKELNDLYTDCKELCLLEYNIYMNKFENIEYCDPDVDYEKFCKLNQINNNVRCLSKFYVELVNHNIFDISLIIKLIFLMQHNLIEKGKLDTPKENPCIEYSENLFILITGCLEKLKSTKEWDDIYKNIMFVRNVDRKIHKNTTSKVIFKHMDILDKINK